VPELHQPDLDAPLPHDIELVEIPSANHTLGTPAGIPRAVMTRITTAVTEWTDRQLPID